MPQVTAIVPQKRRKDRVNVYIDGVFAFSLTVEAVLKKGFRLGCDLSTAEIEKLVKEDEFGKVLDKVLKFISYRPRSEREISDYFKKNQVGEYVKKPVIEKLKKYGYVDDGAFVDWWIKQRQEFRPRSKRVLMLELLKKGIDKNLIQEKLSEIEESSEEQTCLRLAEKRKSYFKNLSSREAKIKLSQYLMRKGYGWDIVKTVVDKVLGKD